MCNNAPRGGKIATANSKTGIHVVERTYKGAGHKGFRVEKRKSFVPVVRKWIYVFHGSGTISQPGAPALDRVYFASENAGRWFRISSPLTKNHPIGRVTAKGKTPATTTGQFTPFKTGVYYIFLSPMLLGQMAFDELLKKLKAEVSGGKHRPTRDSKPSKKYTGWFNKYRNEPSLSATAVEWSDNTKGNLNRVFVVDPYVFEQDIQLLGFQPALNRLHAFRSNTVAGNKRFIASILNGYIKAGQPNGKITGAFKAGSDIIRARDFPIPSAPTYPTLRAMRPGGYSAVRLDNPQGVHNIKLDSSYWTKAHLQRYLVKPIQGKPFTSFSDYVAKANAADYWLLLDKVEHVALCKHAWQFAAELKAWITSPRHEVLDIEAGDKTRKKTDCRCVNLTIGIRQNAMALQRLGEFPEGRDALRQIFKSSGNARLPKALLDKAGFSTYFTSYRANIEPVMGSTLKLLETTCAALAGERQLAFTADAAMEVLKRFKIPDVSLVTLKRRIEWPDNTTVGYNTIAKRLKISRKGRAALLKARDKWTQAEKYAQPKAVFEKLGKWLSVVNTVFSTAAILENGPKNKAEAAKFVLSHADLTVQAVEFYAKRRAITTAGGISKGAQIGFKAGGSVIGAAGALIDYHCELTNGLTAISNGRTGKAVGHWLQAAGAAVGFGAAAYTVGMSLASIWVGAAGTSALAGPPGWIVALGILLVLAGTIIVSAFTRTAWEDMACYSFLGYSDDNEYDGDDSLPVLLGGPTNPRGKDAERAQLAKLNRFYHDTATQRAALNALMARFKVTVYKGAQVVVEPGMMIHDVSFVFDYKFTLTPQQTGQKGSEVHVRVYCYPYLQKARLHVTHVNCNDASLGFRKNCWCGRLFQVKGGQVVGSVNAAGKPAQAINKLGKITKFAIDPKATGSVRGQIVNIPFEVSVRMCLMNSSNMRSRVAANDSKSGAAIDYGWVPVSKAAKLLVPSRGLNKEYIVTFEGVK